MLFFESVDTNSRPVLNARYLISQIKSKTQSPVGAAFFSKDSAWIPVTEAPGTNPSKSSIVSAVDVPKLNFLKFIVAGNFHQIFT